MANYILKYKGEYRLLAELDQNTNDFVRNPDGSIDDSDVYISCQYGNRIMTYGHIDNKRAVWLIAYIPSLGRGHNIIKALKEKDIEYIDYKESDEEVEFKFKAKDIEVVAELMKAKTAGADISPFSSRNLPKSDVEIPTEEIARYKEITSVIPKGDLLFIHRLTTDFLDDILQKSLRKSTKNKKFDYKTDIKKICMARQIKEYIWVKNLWEEYLKYLKKEIEKNYK